MQLNVAFPKEIHKSEGLSKVLKENGMLSANRTTQLWAKKIWSPHVGERKNRSWAVYPWAFNKQLGCNIIISLPAFPFLSPASFSLPPNIIQGHLAPTRLGSLIRHGDFLKKQVNLKSKLAPINHGCLHKCTQAMRSLSRLCSN